MKTTASLLLFWGDADIYSNFHPAPFSIDGQSFHCSEQSFMYDKARYFNDQPTAAAILGEATPMGCKMLGRSVRNFDTERWSKVSANVMYSACYHKFQQNPRLKAQLLASAPRTLVEASPYDQIWGIGLDEDDPDALNPGKWLGENRLGIVLMAVRDALAEGK